MSGEGRAAVLILLYRNYAEADDGAHWSGPYDTNLPMQAFDGCWNTASSQGESVDMRSVTVSKAGWPWVGMINLTS
jgi:hypothetical protein